MGIPVVLMYGLGCDGASILYRWLTDPSSRDFELEDLIVLTAQTGNEWSHTAWLNETFVFPLLRQHNIRTVQIAKAGPKARDRYVVLSDTRQPTRCYVRGVFSLGEALLDGGTVPQYSEKRRDCSPKAKGILLEDWVETEVGNGKHPSYSLGEAMLLNGAIPQFQAGQRTCSNIHKGEELANWLIDEITNYSLGEDLLFNGAVPQYHPQFRKCSDKQKQQTCNAWVDDNMPTVRVAIGFNADEVYRVERAEFARQKRSNRKNQKGVNRIDFFPLIEWGWARIQTEWFASVLAQGNKFWRSACVFCPFSGIAGPNEEVLEKHRLYPQESGFALLVEFVSRSLNPRQTLYPEGRSLYDMLRDDGNLAALSDLERRLNELPWAIYRIRRIYSTIPYRRTDILERCERSDVDQLLRLYAKRLGAELTSEPDGILRGYFTRKSRKRLEGERLTEDLIAAVPAVVLEKRRKGFNKEWALAHQLNLF